jgi:hypothetical protein
MNDDERLIREKLAVSGGDAPGAELAENPGDRRPLLPFVWRASDRLKPRPHRRLLGMPVPG